MTDPIIKVYGTTWCLDTHIVLDFFEEHQIEFDWIDVDQSAEAEQLVRQINSGYRSVPTIVLPDGTTLTEPNRQQLFSTFINDD